jgi:competence protein ComEC
MPTASWILLTIIIGSAAGAAGTPTIAVASGLLVAAIVVRLRAHGATAVGAAGLLAIAAATRATATRWNAAHCRDTIVRARSVEFVADFDLRSGDAGPAILRTNKDDCTTAGTVRARTTLAGGYWYRTFAHVEPGEHSVAVTVDDSVQQLNETSLRPILRADGVRRVDSVFTVDAPMARALLLADMHLIAPDMRQRWARSGLVHLLSVSGVHVAIIAAALLMLGSAARLTKRHATFLALGMTAVYVLILGLPPPAVRAGVMFGSLLIAKLRQRPASEWSVLTLGALLPVIVDPAAPLDLGWQLSVLGVVSLAASARLIRRLGWAGGGWLHGLRREMIASVVASAASAPLIAWYFGTLSVIAPLSNLFAAPLVTLLQPTLFLALACSPSLKVARFVASAAHPVLALLDGVAATAARPSWAAITVSPTLDQTLLAGVIVLALMMAMVQRSPGKPLLVAGTSCALLAWQNLLPSRASGLLELHMLDVGQGDAIAVRTPHGHWIIIDAGGGAPGVDKGQRVVLPYIRTLGGAVDAFILSHPHLDHVGGAPAVIGATRPARYFDAAYAGGTEAYRASLESTAAHSLRWQRVHPGDTASIDGVLLRFLAPDSTWTAALHDANLASTIVRIEYGSIAMLLVGDAERPEEAWLLEHTAAALLRADVLKVGHHGSRTSSGMPFLDAVSPRVALVSVGRGNTYGLPSPEIMQEYLRRGTLLLRTDVVGTTVVRTDGHELTVLTAARQWSLPSTHSANGSDAESSLR